MGALERVGGVDPRTRLSGGVRASKGATTFVDLPISATLLLPRGPVAYGNAMILSPDQYASLRFALNADLGLFAPELSVAGTILLALFLRVFKTFDRIHLNAVAVWPLLAALVSLGLQWYDLFHELPGGPIFTGLLQMDAFATFLRTLLILFALDALWLGGITGLADREDSADYLVLLLGGTLGMMVMVSANHLLMVFVGLEMASLPCYALAGFLKGRKAGSESALKYVLYGSAASGVALYGMSLLVAQFGTGSLTGIAHGYADLVKSGGIDGATFAATALVLAGFAFKLSAVPFHFWLPDVFEGAAAEVGAFLSVASKAAAVGLTARFLMILQREVGPLDPGLLPRTLGVPLLISAMLTMTLGNLAALQQVNLKRLLAYSTIAHAGVLLLGLAIFTADGASATLYYLLGYLPTNLAAFAVVAILRQRAGIETLDGLRGLWLRSPGLAGALAISVLSLLGLPPLVGFAGKFQVFEALYEAGRANPSVGAWHFVALGVAVLNTAISAGYYLKVLKLSFLDEPEVGAAPIEEGASAGALLGVLAIAIVVLGLAWNPVVLFTARAVAGMG